MTVNLEMYKGFLPDDIYKIVLENVPIVCVEAVITDERGYLLGKRTNEPEKGLFGVIGGRIHRGESLEAGLARELEREAEITSFEHEFVAHDSLYGLTSEFGVPYHVISHIYRINTNQEPRITDENSEFKYAQEVDASWAPNAVRIVEHVRRMHDD